MSIYQQIPTYVNLPSSTYLPLPIPKYQYIIAADLGVGIGLVITRVFTIVFGSFVVGISVLCCGTIVVKFQALVLY